MWITSQQALFLEFENHLVNAGRCNPEKTLNICLCWRATIDFSIVIDKSQILALLRREVEHTPHFFTNWCFLTKLGMRFCRLTPPITRLARLAKRRCSLDTFTGPTNPNKNLACQFALIGFVRHGLAHQHGCFSKPASVKRPNFTNYDHLKRKTYPALFHEAFNFLFSFSSLFFVSVYSLARFL